MTTYSLPSMEFMIIDSLQRRNAAVALFNVDLAGQFFLAQIEHPASLPQPFAEGALNVLASAHPALTPFCPYIQPARVPFEHCLYRRLYRCRYQWAVPANKSAVVR